MIGYILMCYGCFDALSSMICSYLVKAVGRIPVFVAGALINASVIAVFLIWRPNPEQRISFFVIAAFWGFSDGIWQTQINGKVS